MAEKVANQRSGVKWVPIEDVVPNPLNPRKNDAIKSEEMKEIILKRGWEEPITVYQKGRMYVVLAGHRRLRAAKEAKIKEIPVYIVEPPQNHQEEIERIASLQRGRVDWTPYEWGKFTYERWIAWGQPKISKFAKHIGIPANRVKEYINVFSYYPRHEIEHGLQSEVYSISALDVLVDWIGKLKVEKPEIVNKLTEEMIRKVMLNKLSNKLVSRDSLRKTELLEIISDEDLMEFLTSTDINLQDVLDMYEIRKNKNTLHSQLVRIGRLNKDIREITLAHEDDREKYINALEELDKVIKKKLRELKNGK